MIYGETGKTSIKPIIEKENNLILATAHTRRNTKAYILILLCIPFHNQIAQQEPILIPVDRKHCRNYSELWDVPLLEKSKSKYGYPINQLMYKRTNQ